MNVSSLLAFFGWLLVIGTVVALGVALYEGITIFEGLKNAVSVGVLLALAGHLLTQSKALAESAEKRSLFNLEGFQKAFAHAKDLLVDGNNNRPTWIEAARSLSHGEELAKAVSLESHKRVLELERLERVRHIEELAHGLTSKWQRRQNEAQPRFGVAAHNRERVF